MLLLNKSIILIILSIQCFSLTTTETPLFPPSLSAREVSLSKASSGDHYFNNMLRNPASIANTKGISIQTNEYLDIDYSSIIFVNDYKEYNFGIHYIGSSINDINRSIVSGTTIEELDTYVPYEYHALSGALAKRVNDISFGIGVRYKTLILDNTVNQSIEGFTGVGVKLFKQFKLSTSIQNLTIENPTPNALQYEHPIYTTAINYYVTPGTTFFLAFIHNENEVSTHLTVHYSLEHYINHFIPFRVGLDHNRYTFGVGLILDPFEIDIGWAQSRSTEIDDQVTIGFSYLFEQQHRLYK